VGITTIVFNQYYPSSFKHAEDGCMIGLVDLRARHSAKIQAKKWYFTAYRVL
jgi:hypothetical protein